MSATWLGFRSLLSHDTGKTRERDMRVTYLPRAALLSFAVLAVAATPAAAKTISVSAGTPDANEKLQERSEEHTSELQSLMRISYAVFCLKKKKQTTKKQT